MINLIVNTTVAGDSGTNNAGDGVVTVTVEQVSVSKLAFVQMALEPLAAVNAGAGWQLAEIRVSFRPPVFVRFTNPKKFGH